MLYDIFSFRVATQDLCHHYYSCMPEIISPCVQVMFCPKVVLNSSLDVINLLFNPQRHYFWKFFTSCNLLLWTQDFLPPTKKKKILWYSWKNVLEWKTLCVEFGASFANETVFFIITPTWQNCNTPKINDKLNSRLCDISYLAPIRIVLPGQTASVISFKSC